MNCPECGTRNESTANFCHTCGYPLKDAMSQRKQAFSNQATSQEPFYPPPKPEHGYIPPVVIDRGPVVDQTGFWNYLAALLFFPIGPVMWAYMRDKKPNSARNLLLTSIGGLFLWFFLLTSLERS